MEKYPVIVVVGATASGKTALAVELAKRFGGEVISADSMQIYQGMDIATAKPTPEEMQGVRHHLVDFLPVEETYSVARFIQDANAAADEIIAAGKIPVIAGGTGLYIDSLLENILFEEEPDHSELREKLAERRQREGIEALYRELASVDPEAAAALHINNEKRVLRALEVYYLTGETLSERRKRSRPVPSRFDPVYVGLDYADREKLYDRINLRVDRMLENGLLQEAERYCALENAATSSQAIGYKELKGYINGEIPLREAVENLKRSTRRYAKRQLTWFRRNEKVHWLYCDTFPDRAGIIEAAAGIVSQSGIFGKETE